MEINIKWNICRICLKDSDGCVLSHQIFEMDDKIPVHEKLSNCGGFEINKNENLPDKICTECAILLTEAYDFRTKCRDSNKHLQTILLQTRSLSLIKPTVKKMSVKKENENISQHDLEPHPGPDDDEIEVVGEPTRADPLKSENWDDQDDNIEMETESDFPEEFKNFQDDKSIESDNAVFAVIEDDDDDSVIYEFESDDKISIVYEGEHDKPCPTISEHSSNGMDDKYTVAENTDDEVTTCSISIQKMNKVIRPGSFICEICGNSYMKKSAFTNHVKSHHNLRPYECELCSKRFTMSCNLIAHIRTHTGEKPFKCQFCDRRFANRSTHLKHERIHKNERPFVCSICNKAFTYSNGLKAHEKIHTGEKNYKCETCAKNFTLPHQLKAHLATNAHRENMIKVKEN